MADLKAMVRRKAEEKGLGQYWAYIDQLVQLESGWNPSIPSQFNARGTEDSWGLFQLNRMGGLGAGKSVQELKNPETNAEIALSAIEGALRGGAGIWEALSPWANARQQILGQGGVSAAGTQGGGTMTDGQTQTIPGSLQRVFDDLNRMFESDDPQDHINAWYALGQLPANAKALYLGLAAAEPEALEAPSPQAQAVTQFDLDRLLAQAQTDVQKVGIEVAAKNFTNQITELQEGRATAEYAQEYAQQLAPPGVTTLPGMGPESGRAQLFERVGWQPPAALPLSPAPAAGPYQALGQAQQNVPQAPNLQFQAPALPGRVDLSQLSPFPQVAPSPLAGGAALPMVPGGAEQAPTGNIPLLDPWALPFTRQDADGRTVLGQNLARILQMLGLGGGMNGAQLPI